MLNVKVMKQETSNDRIYTSKKQSILMGSH